MILKENLAIIILILTASLYNLNYAFIFLTKKHFKTNNFVNLLMVITPGLITGNIVIGVIMAIPLFFMTKYFFGKYTIFNMNPEILYLKLYEIAEKKRINFREDRNGIYIYDENSKIIFQYVAFINTIVIITIGKKRKAQIILKELFDNLDSTTNGEISFNLFFYFFFQCILFIGQLNVRTGAVSITWLTFAIIVTSNIIYVTFINRNISNNAIKNFSTESNEEEFLIKKTNQFLLNNSNKSYIYSMKEQIKIIELYNESIKILSDKFDRRELSYMKYKTLLKTKKDVIIKNIREIISTENINDNILKSIIEENEHIYKSYYDVIENLKKYENKDTISRIDFQEALLKLEKINLNV